MVVSMEISSARRYFRRNFTTDSEIFRKCYPTMSTEDIQSLKKEIEKHEKTLGELVLKWEEETMLKRLSKKEQAGILRAVVSTKRLASVLIPKVKFKIDLLQKTSSDRRLWGITIDEWNLIKPKVEAVQREFEILENGLKAEYPTREQKQRDLILSKNIEESLRRRRQQGTVMSDTSASSNLHEDGSGDMGRDVSEMLADVGATRDFGIGDAQPSTSEIANDDDYDRKLLRSVKNLKEHLSKGQSVGALSEIVDDVCPDDAASVKLYIRSLAASETISADDNILSQDMLDEIRGFDADEIDQKRAERNERLAKSSEIREKRIQKLEKLSEVEQLSTRAPLPSALPIDGFLDVVETLPGEIQKLVFKETEELSEYYKKQFFLKKEPLSSRRGKLTRMDRLNPEYQDKRFDASEFHMRVPESVIVETQKKLKEHRVDNAVERYFGTFGSPPESGDAEASESPQYFDNDDDDMNLSVGRD